MAISYANNYVCLYTALKAINNEFVYGFTQAMDGEKDPRNLMAAFKLVKLIVQHFDIGAHVEVMYNTSCILWILL